MRSSHAAVAAALTVGAFALGSNVAQAADPAAGLHQATAQPCSFSASLTGLGGVKLLAGGPDVTATVTFTNHSATAVPKADEVLEFSFESAHSYTYPDTTLAVELRTPSGWTPLAYSDSRLLIRSNVTLAAGQTDTVQLRVRATQFNSTWSETASALVGTGLPIPTPVKAGPSAPPPSGTVCGGADQADYAVSDQTFAIPGSASGKPSTSASGTPSASATRSPSASPSPSASSTGNSSATSASPTGPALANTGGGSGSGTIAGAAGALVIAGAAGVFAVRRRKAAHN